MPTQKDPTIFGYQNFYSTTLTGDITSGTLTIGLATVPTPTSGILIIEPDSTSSREIVFYTSKGASTITCPSDGRGWSGSSASAHLTGSTVIMASVDEYFEGLADGTLSTDPIRTAVISNHVVSGGIVAQSAGLVGTFSNIVFYLNGQRYSGSSIANKTYTASKDTYVDVTAASGGVVTVTYNEVANGAAAPALAANNVRVAKVVTNGSAITSVTQTGVDSLNNQINPVSPISNSWQSWVPTWTNLTVGNGVTVARYIQIGKTVHFQLNFTLGTTSAVGSTPTVTLPVAAANSHVIDSVNGSMLGTFMFTDAGSAVFMGNGRLQTSTVVNIAVYGASITYVHQPTGLTSTVPFTWGTGDIIHWSGTYEAA
jgi:hypothetical protein